MKSILIDDFGEGRISPVTKASLAGFGMNWQHSRYFRICIK